MARLAPHFVSAEFDSRDGAAAPPGYLRHARRLCLDYLEPLRSEFGPVTVNSGFRSATHNRVVGGARASYHLWIPGRPGAGADVSCRRGAPADWYEFLDDLAVPGLGRYRTHVHADNRSGRARW